MKYTIEKQDSGYTIEAWTNSTTGVRTETHARSNLDEALGTLRERFEPESKSREHFNEHLVTKLGD